MTRQRQDSYMNLCCQGRKIVLCSVCLDGLGQIIPHFLVQPFVVIGDAFRTIFPISPSVWMVADSVQKRDKWHGVLG